MSPVNLLNDNCGVFHQLEGIQTFTNVFHDNGRANKLCVFALLVAEVLLQYLCTNLVCSWVGFTPSPSKLS